MQKEREEGDGMIEKMKLSISLVLIVTGMLLLILVAFEVSVYIIIFTLIVAFVIIIGVAEYQKPISINFKDVNGSPDRLELINQIVRSNNFVTSVFCFIIGGTFIWICAEEEYIQGIIIGFLFFIPIAFLYSERTCVIFDLLKGTVTTSRGYFGYNKKSAYNITDFDTIKICKSKSHNYEVDGTRELQYGGFVWLCGPEIEIKIMYNEFSYVRAQARYISMFLGLKVQDEKGNVKKMKIDIWHIIVLIIGLILIIIPAYTIQKCIASGNWPTTEGEIIKSEWDEIYTNQADIEYEYWVDEKRYVGNRVSYRWMDSPNLHSDDNGYYERLLEKYPYGKNVTVHYNPDNPDEAVLETNPSWFMWFLVIVGISLCAIVFLPIHKLVHRNKKEIKSTPIKLVISPNEVCPNCNTTFPIKNPESIECPDCKTSLMMNGEGKLMIEN